MTGKWWHGGMVSLDTETTGVNLEDARVAQIALAIIRPTAARREDRVDIRSDLINPGIDMPEEASRINGLTTEHLRDHGGDPTVVLEVYLADLALAITSGLPLVVMNAAFDLTILDREARRNGLAPLVDRLEGRPLAPVIDPLILDRELVKKRRRVSETQGARQLKTLCQVWQIGGTDAGSVHWDDAMAHAADYDLMQAARVVWRMCENSARIAAMSLPDLHAAQTKWAAEQALSLASWFRSQGERAKADSVSTDWPMRLAPPVTYTEQVLV
jgi:DNA polymerase-3 subunit epsilon